MGFEFEKVCKVQFKYWIWCGNEPRGKTHFLEALETEKPHRMGYGSSQRQNPLE